MISVALNDENAVSARLSIPCSGAWIADVEFEAETVPSGRAVIAVGTETLVGTIDARSRGHMGRRTRVQVVAGGGGWDKPVAALDFHNDFGVMSTAVYSVTAASVGEVIADASPVSLGPHFVRSAGPASRVLAGVAWYVDAAGVTRIGTRPPAPKPDDVDVLEWDPIARRAVLASSAVVWPGTVLEDERFGTATVRDVEQTFGASGSRATAWCEPEAQAFASGRLGRALMALARESAGVTYLRPYVYRIATVGADGRVTLQLAGPGDVPRILESVVVWTGVSGLTHTLSPGGRVLVVFEAGDPRRPIVVSFVESVAPTLVTLDAARVDIGGGGAPVVKDTETLRAWMTAIHTATGVVAPEGYASTKLHTD